MFSCISFRSLQNIARVWRPALRCGSCSYPNDDCFQFCQQCGVERAYRLQTRRGDQHSIDVKSIDDRIDELNKARSVRPYERQKSKLELELVGFLESLPFPKTLHSACPKDIIRFLVWKDKNGRTQVHIEQCTFYGQPGRHPCNCPHRLAAGTVDSLIGKLRAIFNTRGSVSEWDDFSLRGNPTIHHSVKAYLKSIQREQANSRVSPKQANPVFFAKFQKLVNYIRGALQDAGISPIQHYIFARDLAFFTLMFSSGGRAADLGRVKTVDILGSPDSQNLIIHQRVGKTIRGKQSRVIPIRPCQNPAICPVQNLRFYVSFCEAARIRLSNGYLFRSTSNNGSVTDNAFLCSAANSRLVKYLTNIGVYEGETAHSFRSGAAIMLRLLGASKEEVANHIGWQSTQMVNLYTQTEKVMSISSTSATPPSNPLNLEDGDLVERISSEFRERNLLIGFSPVFVEPNS